MLKNAVTFKPKNSHGQLYFAWSVFVLGLATIYVVYYFRLPYPPTPIRSDGIGYYMYLPAVFIDHDISLQSAAIRYFDGEIPPWTGIKRVNETGKYLTKYPMGEALLMLPFFTAAYLCSFLMGASQGIDGFSPMFQYAMAISGLFYAVTGLLILWTILQKYFKQSTVLLVLAGLLFGSNLFHYATYDAIFSHTYSFFLFSLFLYSIEFLYSIHSTYSFALAGVVAGLIIITRPTNVIWLIFGVLYGVSSLGSLKDRISFVREHKARYLLGTVVLLAVVSLQLIYWKAITGKYIVYSYDQEGFNFLQPQIINVLFSVRKGLFFWSPLLLTIIPGLFLLKRYTPQFFVPVLVILPLNTYVISSWNIWWYGGSFGSRPFLESLPIFALSLCSLYEGTKRGRNALVAYIVLCALLSTWLMLKYWLGTISFEGPSWTEFVSTFFIVRR